MNFNAINIITTGLVAIYQVNRQRKVTFCMVTSGQLRAARALLAIDQRQLAKMASLSVPTIQRMEGSSGVIRGNVDSLMKLISALDMAGIELISEGAVSSEGGRGVRLKARLHIADLGLDQSAQALKL